MWLFFCEWNTDDDGWKNLLDPWKVVPSNRSLGYFRLQRSSRLKTSVISKRERRQLKNAKLLIYFSTCNLFTHLDSNASLIAEMISLLPQTFLIVGAVWHSNYTQQWLRLESLGLEASCGKQKVFLFFFTQVFPSLFMCTDESNAQMHFRKRLSDHVHCFLNFLNDYHILPLWWLFFYLPSVC